MLKRQKNKMMMFPPSPKKASAKTGVYNIFCTRFLFSPRCKNYLI